MKPEINSEGIITMSALKNQIFSYLLQFTNSLTSQTSILSFILAALKTGDYTLIIILAS